MKFKMLFLSASLVCGAYAAEQTSIAIRGAIVHPVSGPIITDGIVLVDGGKITAVGKEILIPTNAAIVEAAGLHLYPGLINADTTLGLMEIPTVAGTVDTRETGQVNPHLQTEVAFNPGSHLIGVARAGGVTTVITKPEGPLLAGTAVAMNLQGWTWEEMLLKPKAAIHLQFPRLAQAQPWEKKKSDDELKKEREKKLKDLNQIFDDAESYKKAKSNQSGPPLPFEPRLEALLPVLEGKIPLLVTAIDLPTIKSAVEWAEKRKVRIILRGAADAWRWADELAKKKIPVVLSETLSLPQREDEAYDTAFTMPAILHKAGVLFCLTSDDNASQVMNLQHQAGMAAAFGLPPEVAVQAITLFPAQIFGVQDRIGSIEVGKDANLILTDGDILEVSTKVLQVWIAGQPVDLRNKQTQLYEQYLSRSSKQ